MTSVGVEYNHCGLLDKATCSRYTSYLHLPKVPRKSQIMTASVSGTRAGLSSRLPTILQTLQPLAAILNSVRGGG
jgi:hypothetical protein